MGALKVHQQMALAKYERLNTVEKNRVKIRLNEIAKGKGYMNENEMREQKPHIWLQLCADTVTQLFP